MATLRDVAKLANVDISTVSRALNNTSYVHPDTRERIMAAVKELSYKPNVLAKGLRQGKTHTIAIVVPKLSFSIFSEVVSGIEQAAREPGYATLIVNTGNDRLVEKEALNRLRNNFVDGLIIAGTGLNNRLIRDIHMDMPVVQVIREPDAQISSVVVDYIDIGYRSVMHLYHKGCRYIGLINGSTKIKPYADRYLGYRRAIREYSLTEITAEQPSKLHGMKYGYDCANRLLDENSRLDAILAATDEQGMGVLRTLKENKIAVPEDMRVLSMTGHRIGDMLETSLTSVELPGFPIGVQAMDLILRDIEQRKAKARPLQKLTFSAALIERESTR